jgi:hypothetical protein
LGATDNIISCKEAGLLINGSIDNQLTSKEQHQLNHHISLCQKCRSLSVGFAAMETNLAELNLAYQSHRLDKSFNAKVLKKISTNQLALNKKSNPLKDFCFFFISKVKELRFTPLVLTGFAGVLILFFLWPGSTFLEKPQSDRFFVQEIPFLSAKENLVWNHQHTVKPGHEAKFLVQKQDSHSVHFRLSSTIPVKVKLSHKQSDEHLMSSQEFVLNGIRYSTLKAPRSQDVVDIVNMGNQPVQVDAYSRPPGYMEVKLINFQKK